MTKQKLLFHNCRILDPSTQTDAIGEVLVEGNRITRLTTAKANSKKSSAGQIIDCQGHALMAGVIDMRVQSRHPDSPHKETPSSLARAAITSGITSIVCLPNTDPVLDDPELLKSQCRMLADSPSPLSRLRVYAYGATTRGLKGTALAELGLLAEAGAVGFTDATHSISDSLVMRRALSYASMFGMPIIQHAEDPWLAVNGEMHEGESSTRLGLRGIPAVAESIIIARGLALLRIADMTHARYHVAHVATAQGVALIRQAKAEGLAVTADTAPPYYLLNDVATKAYDSRFHLSPPLRSEADRQAVLAGLVDGTIDAIASDHAPQDRDSKALPFGQAEGGYSGVETLLALALLPYHNGEMGLLRAIDAVTSAPAKCLGLGGGRLAEGETADVILVDIDCGRQIRGEEFQSLSATTPFEGMPIQGKVLGVWIDGEEVYRGQPNSADKAKA